MKPTAIIKGVNKEDSSNFLFKKKRLLEVTIAKKKEELDYLKNQLEKMKILFQLKVEEEKKEEV